MGSMNVCMKSIVLIPLEKMNSFAKNVQYFMHGSNSTINKVNYHAVYNEWHYLLVEMNKNCE